MRSQAASSSPPITSRIPVSKEVFHTFIDADLSRVRSLTGSDDDERSLGEITSTEDPTYCTDESLEATAEDEKIV